MLEPFNLLLIISSAMIAIAAIVADIVISKRFPDSISSLSYVIGGKLFSVWIIVVGGLLCPVIFEILPDSFECLGFVSFVGLLFVSSSPYYKEENAMLHYVGGFVCGISYAVVAYILNCYLLLLWVPYLFYLFISDRKYYTIFAELVVYCQLICALLIP